MIKPPPREEPASPDFFWHNMRQYSDISDIAQFARDGEAYFKKWHDDRLAGIPEKQREVEAIFTPPHAMHIHWAVIILLGIRLEENIHKIAETLKQRDHLAKSINDFKERVSLVHKFELFLTQSALWTRAQLPNDQSWTDVRGVYAIRNCLIHTQANLRAFRETNARQAEQLLLFIGRHNTPGIVDSWLDIDLTTSEVCVSVLRKFFDDLFAPLQLRDDYLQNSEAPSSSQL